jgi:hypothetical protein
MKKHTCPCCGYETIEREDTFYDLCPVCFWETDPYQLANPEYKGGANQSSLTEAQQHFILFGACEKDDVFKTRMPLADEPKDEHWQTFDQQKNGSLFFKRPWDETSGNPKTDNWGTSIYYFETDEKGDVSKQMEVYRNDKTLKYSNLNMEDDFGGLTDHALDLTDKAYISIDKNEFFKLWNTPIIERFAKQKIHLLGWHIAEFKEKLIYPSPVFTEEETLISATLDHRFMLDLGYETNAKFTLKIKEGNTWIQFFNYMKWEEAEAVTQKWINEIQEANKTVDVPKAEEEQAFDVRVNIDNQIVMSKLTTWRNMDWEVGKYRNIQIQIGEELYSIIDTFTDFENMILALQKSLPKNYKIETCFFCRFSTYNIYGNDDYGELICLKNHKTAFLKVDDKFSLLDLLTPIENKEFVNETDYCDEFVWIKGNEWAFKNQMKA